MLGMIAPYLASSSVNLFKPENKNQFKLIKSHNSIRMNAFLIQESIPITLYSNMLTFRGSKKSFKLDGDLLKMITNYKFNVGHSNLQDRKIFREIAEEVNFDIENIGQKVDRDRSIVELPNTPAIKASGISTKLHHLILMNSVID